MLINSLLIGVSFFVAAILFHPKIRKHEHWRATLTPLSSIIGSGFLVIAPILAGVVGIISPLAVTAIVLITYAAGYVIRFNIEHLEPALTDKTVPLLAREVELVANFVLSIAYAIAVAFYLLLLSSFVLHYLSIENLFYEKLLTTFLICLIAVVGYFKGLAGLEKLEEYSMSMQLSIVVALLMGLFIYDFNFLTSDSTFNLEPTERGWLEQVQILAGILLVAQGFETSRFLGSEYKPQVRISSMRQAQIISSIIYIVSVTAFLPVMQHINLENIEVAEVIDVSARVATVLPFMLIVAALMSQFSAAVADTAGSGGLVHENSGNRLSPNFSYIAISVATIFLVWNMDIFEVIAFASRAFALYYLLQTGLAFYLCQVRKEGVCRLNHSLLFSGLIAILSFVVLFSVSVE